MKNSVNALLLIALAGPLSGCGKGNEQDLKALQAKIAKDEEKRQQDEVANYKYSLNDGATICLRQVQARLGAGAMVGEILSNFEKPETLTGLPVYGARPKPGTLSGCRADYQDPANPQKMLRLEMNAKTGEFSAPKPLEIKVLGGDDAAKFDLNKHVSPIKKWNLDAVEKLISAQNGAAEKAFSIYQIDSTSLKMDPFQGRFEIRASFAGRLKGNDLLQDKGVSVLADGTKVTSAFR